MVIAFAPREQSNQMANAVVQNNFSETDVSQQTQTGPGPPVDQEMTGSVNLYLHPFKGRCLRDFAVNCDTCWDIHFIATKTLKVNNDICAFGAVHY